MKDRWPAIKKEGNGGGAYAALRRRERLLSPALGGAHLCPVGETPILHHTLSHDPLSVIGAVGLHERLYFQVYEEAIRSAEVIRFLNHLLRHIPGKLLILWDGAPIHRSTAIKQFLSDGAAARIHLERFPGYAPELDPQEGIWRHLKRVGLRNLCCADLQETRRELRAACRASARSRTSSRVACATAGSFRCSRAAQ